MMTKPDWILKRVELSPEKCALINVHTDERWTYSKLREQIDKWVAFFEKKQYEKGERIVVLSINSIELFPIMFACSISGLIYVPLNWRLSKAELLAILEDCDASVLLYEAGFEETAKSMTCRDLVEIGSIKEIEKYEGISSVASYDPWLMIYTGGTTGKPKGVVLSHEAVYTNAVNTIVSWGLSEEDVTINYMPLFHTGGINALSIPILMAGGTVVIGHAFSADEALQATDEYEATVSLFVPTMYQEMIRAPYFKQSSFPSMKTFLSGGAPCPQNIYQHFWEKCLNFKEGYGLTEAGPNNFFIRPEEAKKKCGSVGKSMLLNDVAIMDASGNRCHVNEVGELYLKGSHLFTSYWNNEIETNKAFHQSGWFKTGDLARFDEDGDYYIIGRVKDLIITGGENVYPQEVEQCLLRFPNVREAAVVGIPDEKWGEAVTAFLALEDIHSFNEHELLEHCKNYLGNFKLPKKIMVLNELPKTDVGKIDKNQLKLKN